MSGHNWPGGQRGSNGGMYPAWGGAPGAPAPGQPGYRRESSGGRSGGGNKQEHLKQAAAQRRKAEAAHAAAEQRRQAGEVAEDLFSAPRRTVSSDFSKLTSTVSTEFYFEWVTPHPSQFTFTIIARIYLILIN